MPDHQTEASRAEAHSWQGAIERSVLRHLAGTLTIHGLALVVLPPSAEGQTPTVTLVPARIAEGASVRRHQAPDLGDALIEALEGLR